MLTHIVLDRDGTLIRHVPYLHDVRRVAVLPTVVQGLRELLKSGRKLFLHTNQSGIGRGYFELEQAVACNNEMLRQLNLGPALFEDICICAEAPDQPISYRKPSPKYAREIMAKYRLDAGALCYVGDNLSDLQTAVNVGCAGVGVDTGSHDLRRLLAEHGLEFPVFDNFVDAVNEIVHHGRRSNGTS